MSIQGHITFTKMEEVIFGKPAASAAAECAERFGARRVFLMVSGTLNRETDEITRLRDALGSRVAAEFDAMKPHTPRRAVMEAVSSARAADADLIITLGGGSITDAAKAVQLCLANDIHTPEAIDALRDTSTLKAPTVRQITIPTTLSGGEFGFHCGVTDERTKAKELLSHPSVIPQVAILDPAVTVHTPEWLWLSTGIRAVDHCVEGACSAEAHPFGDAQALKGLALLTNGLAAAKANPGDLDARLDCQMGTWLSMGALASGVPMGASHGIGYVLGARHGIPHGHTSCIMLPAAMRWNLEHNGERQKAVAAAMGHPGEQAGDVLDRFIASLGMPRSLSEVGITREDLPAIAKGAMATPWIPRNPRPIAGPDDVMEILDLAF